MNFASQRAVLSLVLAFCVFIDSDIVVHFAQPIFDMISDTLTSGPKDDAVVVLITDADGPDMVDKWPPPFVAYTNFLRAVGCFNARGVFIDIGLSPASEQAQEPASERAQESAAPGKSQLPALTETIAALWEKPSSLIASCPYYLRASALQPPSIPVFFANPFGELIQKAVLHRASAFVGKGNIYQSDDSQLRLATAAVALVDALECSHDASQGYLGSATHAEPAGGDVGDPPPSPACLATTLDRFVIRDTFFTPATQTAFISPQQASHCLFYGSVPAHETVWLPRQNAPTAVARLFDAADRYLSRVWRLGILHERADWAACPPVVTIAWQRLYDPEGWEYVAKAIEGKYVFLGAALAGIRDPADTSFHEDMPGVYLHALALEEILGAAPVLPALPELRIALLAVFSFVVMLALEQLRNVEKKARAKHVADQSASSPQVGARSKRHLSHRIQSFLTVVTGATGFFFLARFLFHWNPGTSLSDALFFVSCNDVDLRFLDPIRLLEYLIRTIRKQLHLRM